MKRQPVAGIRDRDEGVIPPAGYLKGAAEHQHAVRMDADRRVGVLPRAADQRVAPGLRMDDGTMGVSVDAEEHDVAPVVER